MKAFPAVDRVCVHSFLPGAIRSGGIVLDLGANRGDFARTIAGRFECEVHAVEPHPEYHERLRKIPNVQLHTVCLAPTDGEVNLHVPEAGDATLFPGQRDMDATIRVRGVTLSRLLETVGASELDLIKLDVEGAELPILEQTPANVLLRARQITVEFHDWKRPETADRVRKVKRSLQQIGFYCIRFSSNNGDVLFVRRDILHPLQYIFLVLFVRNVRGARRILRRYTGGWFNMVP